MPKFIVTFTREIEAPTFRDAALGAFAAAKPGKAIAVQVGGRGPACTIDLLAPWDDVARCKAMGFTVEPAGSSFYVERRNGDPFKQGGKLFNDWHMSEEAAWLAVARYAKREYADAWRTLG